MSARDPADLRLAVEAAKRAGGALLQWFGKSLEVHHKSPDQPVTDADLAADDAIRELILLERPDDGWLSEETVGEPDRAVRRRVWLIDPLDGTRSFIAGHPEFAVSIALLEAGEPVVGVVYNPASSELFRAVRGGGAFLERGGDTVRMSVEGGAADRVLVASRSEIAAGELDPFRADWRLFPLGSTAYKLAMVGTGRASAYLSRGPKSEWDVCAGVLLVQEAGGRVSDVAGHALRFKGRRAELYGILATNGVLHDTLLKTLTSLPPSARMIRSELLRNLQRGD